MKLVRAVRELDPPRGAAVAPPPAAGRLALHVIALGVALVLMMLWTGPGRFTIDETAYRQQAMAVRDGERELDYPEQANGVVVPAVAPLALSATSTTGWAPYGRHPLYPELLAASLPVSSTYGPVLWSILGTLVAAVGTGRLRRWFDGGSPVPVVWITGLLSPLAFHAQVVWAHSLAVALVAVGLAAGFEAASRPSRWVPVAGVAAAAMGGSVLLRTEAPFAVVALVVALFAVPGSTTRRWFSVSTLIGCVSVAAVLVDRRWAASGSSGERVSPPPVTETDASLFSDRLEAVASLVVNVSGTGLVSALWLLAPILLTAAWVKQRGPEPDHVLAMLLASLATAAAVVASTSVETLTGWVPAIPVLGLAIGHGLTDRRCRPLVIFVAVVVVAVLSTGPPGAGGLGWGGRYVLATVPAMVVLVVAAVQAMRDTPTGRIVIAACLAVTVLVQINGARVLERNHDASRVVEADLGAVLRSLAADDQVIVAPDIRVGRAAPAAAIETGLLSASDVAQLPFVLDSAISVGIERVALIELADHPAVAAPADWRLVQSDDDGLVRIRIVEWER